MKIISLYELSATVESKQLAKTQSTSGSSESGKLPNATFSGHTPSLPCGQWAQKCVSTEDGKTWQLAANIISLLLVMPELIHSKVITSWITRIETLWNKNEDWEYQWFYFHFNGTMFFQFNTQLESWKITKPYSSEYVSCILNRYCLLALMFWTGQQYGEDQRQVPTGCSFKILQRHKEEMCSLTIFVQHGMTQQCTHDLL